VARSPDRATAPSARPIVPENIPSAHRQANSDAANDLTRSRRPQSRGTCPTTFPYGLFASPLPIGTSLTRSPGFPHVVRIENLPAAFESGELSPMTPRAVGLAMGWIQASFQKPWAGNRTSWTRATTPSPVPR